MVEIALGGAILLALGALAYFLKTRSPGQTKTFESTVRGYCTEARQHLNAANRSVRALRSHDSARAVYLLAMKTLQEIDKFLEAIERDPDDYSQADLQLEGVRVVAEALKELAELSVGANKAMFQQELSKTEKTLGDVLKGFQEKREQLMTDNRISLDGKRNAAEELTGSKSFPTDRSDEQPNAQ